MTISSYRDLDVWRTGMWLARECYLLTKAFPRAEMFGLSSQIRRAAVSIPANIAEGWGRDSRREYIRFLRIAQGSLKELETLLQLSTDVGLAAPDAVGTVLKQCDVEGRMLRALYRKLEEGLPDPTPNSPLTIPTSLASE
jgi:four helix bundle protein